ncbi:DUF1292 domain-containing protein [Helicovermis profundi]|uniref:Uncharacterized protein n=1 Tax=Helicovermis profundi TaxID=3065157 RepID=A0AAU9EE73_9FIRM|nr:hypothetical protein HLPR_12980 [Clostridia bacterium S502]
MDNIITLKDEEGKNVDFEVIANFKVDDDEYSVLFPIEENGEEALLFKVIGEEGGETILEYIENDEEFSRASKAYHELMNEKN